MLRRSHLLVSLFFCLMIASHFVPIGSSQSTSRSLSLNGTNQNLTAPSSTSLNITGAITVEAWIKLNSIGAYQIILSREAFQETGTGGGYRLTISNTGKLQLDLFQTHNTYVTVVGVTTVTTGTWHHVAGVFDGGQMRVYVDGVLDGSMSTTSGPGAGTGAFYVGRHSYVFSPYYFGGLIDEVRVSAAALYTSNFTPGLGPGSNVRGLWKFDGQTANDFSGNGNHGTLQNGATYSTDVPPVTNNPPSVSLTDPQNNTSFPAGSNVVMDASAADSDGSVSKVDFYQGATLLGTDTSAPYTYVWHNAPAGVYSLTAMATDDGGAITTSTVITTTVIAPGGSHSLSLNGANQYLTAPSSTSLNITGPITVEAWIKLNAIGAYQIILSREAYGQEGTGGGYRLAITDTGKLRLDLFQTHNTFTTVIGTTTVTTGAWHHAVGVFDGSQMRVYLDGVMDGSVSSSSGPWSGTGAFYIGRHSVSYSPYYFGGMIDEVRVSAAALYMSNFTPGLGPGSNVRGWWKFDGQTANDFSGNGNHGTSQGGATYSTDVPPAGGGGAQRPVPVAGGPYSGQVAQAVQFSSSGSFDPDGTIASYHWNFGDGTSATTTNPSHSYAAPGLYTATLTLTDNAGLRASVTAAVTIANNGNARLDPLNQTGGGGENPLSQNFNWTLPLVSLPGRAGLDLNLSLSYNSLVWTKSGSYISYDDDRGFPGPGFRLGFPLMQPPYYNSEVGKNAFVLIGSDGSRTEMRQVGTSTLYEAADSSYLLLNTNGMVLRTTDGTQLKYELKGGDFQCTEIKDRNGNFITVNYTDFNRIDKVVDTLARSIKFNYDAGGWLTSITQNWNDGLPTQATHNWAQFHYANTTIQTNFSGLTVSGTAPSNGSTLKTLAKVTLADGSHHDFSYTSWGQVWKVSYFSAETTPHLLNYRAYNLPQTSDPNTPYADCPRFTERRDWAENWNQNISGIEQEAITTYTGPVTASWTMPDGSSQSGKRAEVTSPDSTVNKIYFIGTAGSQGWRRGLPALVETYTGANWQRKVMTTWTQDNTSVSYPLNPRVTETNVYDPAGNRARVQFTYQQQTFANGTSCWLPRDVYEYAANASTKLRSTRTDYNTSTFYTDRRIIGLVSEKRLYEGDVSGQLVSKVGYFYDNENGASSIQGNDAPVQHDAAYSESFITGRANLSSVSRYDVTKTAQPTTTRGRYNTAGAVISMSDALDHITQISYTDSFSDGVARNALAYPTTITDPDNYTATAKYNFDFGAVTSRQTPKPNANGATPEQTFSFDAIGRLERTTNLINSAYTRLIYGPNYVRTFSTVNTVADEAQSLQVFDGAGRPIATARNHPGSYGGFSGQLTVYDVMGRVTKQSNATETSISFPQPNAPIHPYAWPVSGDDAAWHYVEQTYDWKGRPLVTTNQDGTTKTAAYTGCGCAGGEVVTLTDEGTLDGGVAKRRQQKLYSDVLGRTWKTEVLNWDGAGPNGTGGSVYSATVNTYNARNQLMSVRQFAGAEGSGTYQDTTMTFDGHGRLKTRHLPEQQVDPNTPGSTDHTTWDYNHDDTIQKITDARGASQTFSYNNRHLTTSITYQAPAGITIPATVSNAYDAAGNRTSMIDGSGTCAYNYDQLSRMTSETHTFNGLTGNFTLSYDYRLNGALKSITDHTNQTVNYAYDNGGRVITVTGTNYVVSQFISSISYRASGAPKQISYGNGRTASWTYNERLQAAHFEIPSTFFGPAFSIDYQYYSDGRIKYSQDLLDGKYDRSYEYDHAGRIKGAFSGAEARGEPTTPDRPYKETFNYDAFNHITTRTTSNWSKVPAFFSNDAYANNRRTGWLYDADGNLTSNARQYTYDAAGRMTFISGDNTNQFFDGNGERVKLTEPDVVTYYLRSAVLGQVIAELDGAGTKTAGFIYLGAKLLARQAQNGSTTFEHDDPSRTKLRYTHAQLGNQTAGAAELDPLGADVYLSDPYLEDPGFEGRGEGFGEFGNVSDPSTGCTVDGLYSPCDIAWRLLQQGAAVQAPAKLTKYNRERKRFEFFRAYADGYSGYVPSDAQYGSGGVARRFSHYDYTSVTVSDTGQTSGAWHAVFETLALTEPQKSQVGSDDLKAYRARIEGMLKEKKCADYIQQLLGEVKTQTGRSFGDILTTFDAIRFYWANTGGAYGGFAYWEEMGTVRAADIMNTIKTERTGGSLANQMDRRAFLISETTQAFLGETMHHLSRNGIYLDGEMANALNAVLVRQGLDTPKVFSDKTKVDVDNASRYWHIKVVSACPAPRR